MQSEIMQYVTANIEYVVAIVGSGGFLIFMTTMKHKGRNGDVSKYIIEIKKHQDMINKRSKSVF